MRFTFRCLLPLAVIASFLPLLCEGIPAAAQTRYRNLRNDRFATVSSGPQSALIVEVATGEDAAATRRRVRLAVQNRWQGQGRAMRAQLEALRKAGVLKPRSTVAVSTIVLEQSAGRLVRAAAPTRATTRQFGGGALTFRYTGFTASDEAFVRALTDLVYPRIVNLYGAPAEGGEVEIVDAGEGLTDVQFLAYGSYNVSQRQILIPRFTDSGREGTAPSLILNLVHAFHGSAVFRYDAWEQGFARAAAAVLVRDPAVQGFLRANGAPTLADDPSSLGHFSWLPFYELLNQPPLGNSTFFPPTQANTPTDITGTGRMILARLGMSGAAWLKVYIENQNFFRDFNADYYAQFNGNANLGGDVPALRAIAAGKLPGGVEGISFGDWFTRQYILDTSVSAGQKLFAFVTPFPLEDVGGTVDQSPSVILVYFRTLADGDEELLNGPAYATYLDSSNATIQLGQGSVQIEQGAGFFTPNVNLSGQDRYSLNFTAGGLTVRTYLPFGFTGDFQGVVVGANSLGGNVTVQQTTLPPVSTRGGSSSASSGAFGTTAGSPPTDLSVTTVTLNRGGATTSFRFNTGDGLYYVILRPDGAVTTATRSFARTTPPQLVSFPIRPLTAAAGVALGLPATDFLLNTWDFAATPPVYRPFVESQVAGTRLEPGTGYWLKVAPSAGATVSIVGTVPPTDTDYTVAIPFGWSLIGSPFGTDINLSDLRVQYLQNDAVPWEEAVGDLVQPEVFGFDPNGADPSAGYQTTTVLQGTQWKGYWIRARVPGGVTLILPGPDSPTRNRSVRDAQTRSAGRPAVPTRSVASGREKGRAEWSVRLTAEQNVGSLAFANRDSVTLGAAKNATRGYDPLWDTEAPPPIVTSVRTSLTGGGIVSGGRATGGHSVADFRDPESAGRAATWDLSVLTPVSGTARLFWDGVGTAPRRTRLTLVDTVTGARTPLRSRSSYTWTGEAGKSRAFRVISEPERSLPLGISNIRVQQSRGGGTRSAGFEGVAISYSVLGDSDPQIEIVISNAFGKTLRRLDGGTPSEASRGAGVGGNGSLQQRTVRWDGRSQDGVPAAFGTLFVTITARGSDGTLVRTRQPILLVR
ncbi:MAG: hypothetical protein H7Z41_13400 [Cytophagales bacterium]|nr:hypothetical protein [Armatimonadota bacterium]